MYCISSVADWPNLRFNPLSFTLAYNYHTLHTYGLSLIVRVCALAACSPPGSVCLYWICLTVCYGQDEMACHLHPIFCTWDAVTTWTPVTVFFPLGMRLCSNKTNQNKKPTKLDGNDTTILSHHPYILCHFANYAHHKTLYIHISLFTPTKMNG